MDDRIWRTIQGLVGQELKTRRGRRFSVSDSSDNAIWVTPLSSGEPRRIRRLRFEQALSLGVPVDQLSPGMLQQRDLGGFHTSYVVAILRALQGKGQL